MQGISILFTFDLLHHLYQRSHQGDVIFAPDQVVRAYFTITHIPSAIRGSLYDQIIDVLIGWQHPDKVSNGKGGNNLLTLLRVYRVYE